MTGKVILFSKMDLSIVNDTKHHLLNQHQTIIYLIVFPHIQIQQRGLNFSNYDLERKSEFGKNTHKIRNNNGDDLKRPSLDFENLEKFQRKRL